MSTRELSSGPARCRRCRAIAIITVRESRYARSVTDLLSRDFDPAPTRTAHCSACDATYPIRGTDEDAAPAAARRGLSDDASGRDWRYPDRRSPVNSA